MAENKFCVVPWRELYSTTLGTYRMCCVEDETESSLNNQTSITKGIEQHWNSDYMREYRLSFLANKQHSSCKHCWRDEDNGKISLRQRRNKQYLGADADDLEQWANHFRSITNSDGSVTPDIQGVYLSVGNACQLRCGHCNPAYSTNVAKEYQRLGWDHNFKTRRVILDDTFLGAGRQQAFDAEAWPQIRSIAHKLRWIRCTGGEPTISRGLLEFMQWLDQQGLAQHIRFYSNTNAVSVSQDWIDAANRFKSVELKIGVDGTALIDNYVRYPTTWQRKIPVVKRLLTQFPNSYVLTTLHAMNVSDFANLLREMQHWPGKRDIAPLTYPTELDIRHMPKQFKQHMVLELEQFIADCVTDQVNYPRSDAHYFFTGIRSVINQLERAGDPIQWDKAKSIIQQYDTIRPHTLASISPGLAPYLT